MADYITKNITREECMCKCKKCGEDTIDYEVARIIQDTCDYYATKLKIKRVYLDITRVCSCPWWNGKKGGAWLSLHEYGRAADISIREVPLTQLYRYLEGKYTDTKYEILLYDTHVHFGIERSDDND